MHSHESTKNEGVAAFVLWGIEITGQIVYDYSLFSSDIYIIIVRAYAI